MNVFSVLKRPLLTEKSNDLRDKVGHYAFSVNSDACKPLVKKAVETVFNVQVDKVRTLIRRGKMKRRGNLMYMTKPMKVAYVTLKDGQSLPLFADR